jgi:hypothetical protein
MESKMNRGRKLKRVASLAAFLVGLTALILASNAASSPSAQSPAPPANLAAHQDVFINWGHGPIEKVSAGLTGPLTSAQRLQRAYAIVVARAKAEGHPVPPPPGTSVYHGTRHVASARRTSECADDDCTSWCTTSAYVPYLTTIDGGYYVTSSNAVDCSGDVFSVSDDQNLNKDGNTCCEAITEYGWEDVSNSTIYSCSLGNNHDYDSDIHVGVQSDEVGDWEYDETTSSASIGCE